VTKYSGIATNQHDIDSIKAINDYLNNLESDLAKEFVSHGDIDYLDRMNTDKLFEELHLSSVAAFNFSSGGLRGLLGRLDFLVVVDSSEPTTARVRLIDVETGAVKAIETCKHKTSFWGISQDGVPDCISSFVASAREVARARLAVNAARLRRQLEQAQAAKQSAVAEQRERIRNQEAAQQLSRAQAGTEAKAQAEVNAQIAAQNEALAKAQAEVDAQIALIRPALDDAMARLVSANAFWEELSRQLASSGQSLRSSVRTLLYSVNADAKRCQEALSRGQVNDLRTCLSRLNRDLDTLDGFK